MILIVWICQREAITGFLEVIRHSWLCKERKTLCAEVTTNLLSEIVKARHGGSCRTWWDLEAGASRVQVIFPYIASSSLGCARPWLGKPNRNCKGGNRILCYKIELQFTLKWTCGHLKLQSDYHSSSQVLVIHPIWSRHISAISPPITRWMRTIQSFIF